MTPAEFKTCREGLGLSCQALADMLDPPVQVRAVQRWEDGDRRIPEGVAALLGELDGIVNRAVARVLDAVREAIVEAGRSRPGAGLPKGIALLRYRRQDDFARWEPTAAEFRHYAVHGAMIRRARDALALAGLPSASIVYFDAEAYTAWLLANDLNHGRAAKARWAAERAAPAS